MKYLDLFSGYGGFSLGIKQAYEKRSVGAEPTDKESEQAEPEIQLWGERTTMEVQPGVLPSYFWGERPVCIGFCEIDKYATQIYKKHFHYEECEQCKKNREHLQGSEWGDIRPIGNQPDTPGGNNQQSETRGDREFQQSKNNCQCKHKEYGDITKLDPTTLPDFDLLTGGFPCQAFSIAGKRGGFEDTRGTLIFDVFRILKEKQPRLVLLENVKGLLSHDNGRTFKTILTTLAELGYAVEWQVLNAKNFGVPQNRERVFIIGHLGGFGGRQVFPIGGAEQKTNEQHLPQRPADTNKPNTPNIKKPSGGG